MSCGCLGSSPAPKSRPTTLEERRVSEVEERQTSVFHRSFEEKVTAHILEYLDPASLLQARRVCFLMDSIVDSEDAKLWIKLLVRLYPWEGMLKSWTQQQEQQAVDAYIRQLSNTERSHPDGVNAAAYEDYLKRVEHWFDPAAVKRKYKETRFYVSDRIPGAIIPDKFQRVEGCERPLFTNKFIFDGHVYKGPKAVLEGGEHVLRALGWSDSLDFDSKSTLAKMYVQEVLFPFDRFQHFITMVVCSEDGQQMFVTLTIFFDTSYRCDVTVIFDINTGACRIRNVVGQSA
eukprot:gb/GECH01005955.1/.p1 GENE.gb/GECH01005955.1/~~gb/GECH01005955.1/.p1  ORF type:complete len:289 (+),score=48.23 gb/GECH01005955.1/:1-867(+)